jgi:hypothetical protein
VLERKWRVFFSEEKREYASKMFPFAYFCCQEVKICHKKKKKKKKKKNQNV